MLQGEERGTWALWVPLEPPQKREELWPLDRFHLTQQERRQPQTECHETWAFDPALQLITMYLRVPSLSAICSSEGC